MAVYTDCEVFSVNDDDEYALFYNTEQTGSGLVQKTETEIIDEIRVGRNLVHLPHFGGKKAGSSDEVHIWYANIEGNVEKAKEVMEKKQGVVMFTETRGIDLEKWKELCGETFSILHMPAFHSSSSSFGGVTILYTKEVLVKNTGRLFTWKHLNTDEGKIFPAVEGVFLDISRVRSESCTRLAAVFHWPHSNSKGVDCRVNITNFLGKICTKEIPPKNDSPVETHVFGRLNLPLNEEFQRKLAQKEPSLSFINSTDPGVFVASTNLFSLKSSEENDVILATVSLV